MCLSAIYWSHIDKIFYANTREDAKNIEFDDLTYFALINLNKKYKIEKYKFYKVYRDSNLKVALKYGIKN